jgi:hypothetical protein
MYLKKKRELLRKSIGISLIKTLKDIIHLVFLHNLWLVFTVSITWNSQLDITLAAADRLGIAPIATVIRLLVLVVNFFDSLEKAAGTQPTA